MSLEDVIHEGFTVMPRDTRGDVTDQFILDKLNVMMAQPEKFANELRKMLRTQLTIESNSLYSKI